MSERVYVPEEFEMNDLVEFDGPGGGRLRGEIARIYNSRQLFHVEVDGERYTVERDGDNMKKVKAR